MSDVAASVLEAGKILTPLIGRHLKYLYDYKNNLENLEKVFNRLKKVKEDVDLQVLLARKNVELKIKDDAKKWQVESSIIIEEAEKFIQEKVNNPRGLDGFCSPLISRYKNGRKAFKLKQKHDFLLQQRDKFKEVSVSIFAEESWLELGDRFLYLEARKSTLESVWDALNNANNVYMIGVYGIEVELAALANGACSKALDNNLFDKFVWVEVTETTDIEKIQDEIAAFFVQKLEGESEKASQIYERLNTGKRILLILNNITRYIDLKSVGIPSEADRGGCKLLLTSTGRRVLDEMGSKTNFEFRFSKQQALDNYFLAYFSLVFTIFVVFFIVFALSFLQRKSGSF